MKNFVTIGLLLLQLYSTAFASSKKEDENKKLVLDFYEKVFVKHDVKDAAEKYLLPSYIQHNPKIATGRSPFIEFFVPFFAKNPGAHSEIKRAIGEGDLVVLHVHSRANKEDRGYAVVDIFRVDDGKIAEHWDVMQPVPEKSANDNKMF